MNYKITVRVKIAGQWRQRTFETESDKSPEDLIKEIESDYDMFKSKLRVTVKQRS
jgi:hypothetical protein